MHELQLFSLKIARVSKKSPIFADAKSGGCVKAVFLCTLKA